MKILAPPLIDGLDVECRPLCGCHVSCQIVIKRTGPLMHHYEGSYNLQEQVTMILSN